MQKPVAEPMEVKTFVSPEHILVATDRTDLEFLLPYAVAQAKATHARLTLVSAMTPGDNLPVDSPSPYIDLAAVKKGARDMLKQHAAEVEEQGVPCQAYVEAGVAADVICGQLRKTRAQRLIMGTHGRGKLGRLTLGSVAGELLRTVQVPVLAIGPRARGHQLNGTPERILHPVSLEGDYRNSVHFAIEVAKASHAELTLMLVLNRDDRNDVNPVRSLEWGRTALSELLHGYDVSGLPVKVHAVFGKVPEEVRRMAEEISADLIVFGVSSKDHFSPFAETTVYKVLACAECPVMTAPHNATAKNPVLERNRELTGVFAESGY